MAVPPGPTLAPVPPPAELSPGPARIRAVEPSPILVAVGDVGATRAVLWARAEGADAATVTLAAADRAGMVPVVLPLDPAGDHTGRAVVHGLRPATRYRYRVEAGGRAVEGTFATAPPDDDPAPVTVLWSGDLGGGGHCRSRAAGYRVFDAMRRRRADLFLFVGDTIYADRPCRGPDVVPGAEAVADTLAGFHARHRHQREDPAVQAFLRTTPVSAIWDDHDVRNNFAGPREPLMPAGRRAFLDFWPVMPAPGEPGRLYRALRWGALLEVFVLDTRQYRSGNCRPDGPGKTMLGAAQRRWLVEAVAASPARWKAVVSSLPLSVPKAWPCGDSWAPTGVLYRTGFAAERGRILEALRARGETDLLWITADVHFAALFEHHPAPGFVVHELIAGPLAAGPARAREPGRGLDSRTRFLAGRVQNFGEVTVGAAGVTVRWFDAAGALLGTRAIAPARRPSIRPGAAAPAHGPAGR